MVSNDIIVYIQATPFSNSGEIKIWHLNGQPQCYSHDNFFVSDMCRYSDTQIITGSTDSQLTLINCQTGKIERSFIGHTDPIMTIDVFPN